jgi:16S rRNA (cytosine1402-N4)-methyltransferase
MDARHEPVMVDEVLSVLEPNRGGLYVDCTAGLGGHSAAILQAGASTLIALDRDEDALRIAGERLAGFGERVALVHADYRDLGGLLDARSIAAVNGILADLGVSSMQLDADARGFSFRRDEPLDMRMDRTQGPTAAELIADAAESDLANVIFQFGEERHSRRVARAIVRARERSPIETTGTLAEIVRRAVPTRGYQRIDPATRTFQAIRIWVNRELEGLDAFITEAARRLLAGARFAIITFHSLEDRIVKHTFRAVVAAGDAWRLITRKPIVPGEDEIARNPRARSAKLRAIERLG